MSNDDFSEEIFSPEPYLDIRLGMDQTRTEHPATIAETFLTENHFISIIGKEIYFWRNSYCFWNNGKYVKTSNEEFITILIRWMRRNEKLKYNFNRNKVKEILAHIQTITFLNESTTPPALLNDNELKVNRIINMKNGIFSITDYINQSHDFFSKSTSDFFTFTTIPIEYKDDAECPLFLEYLNTVQPDKDIQTLLQQWLGYNLFFSNEFEKFAIFVGEGANGKSVFCKIMMAIIGTENISHISLENFDIGRTFPIASTEGKLSNISEELNEIDKTQEGLLKQFISGNSMTVERKFGQPFELIPTARLTFATNVLPRFSERTNALWRRLIIIPWEHTIPENKQDRRFGSITFWQESGELPGIFNWALSGLKLLIESNQFIEPKACEDLKKKYKLDSNPATQFLLDNYCFSQDETDIIPTESIYGEYKKFTEKFGYRPISASNLSKEIKKNFPSAFQPENAINQDGKRRRVWQKLKKINN